MSSNYHKTFLPLLAKCTCGTHVYLKYIIEHPKVYFVVWVVYSVKVNDNGTFHWPKMKGTSVSIKNS